MCKGQFLKHFTLAFFVQKCSSQLFSVTFWLRNFWREDIGKKSTRKMLMKLTPVLPPLG